MQTGLTGCGDVAIANGALHLDESDLGSGIEEMTSFSAVQSLIETMSALHPEYFEPTLMSGGLVTAPDSDIEPILQAWAGSFATSFGRRSGVIHRDGCRVRRRWSG